MRDEELDTPAGPLENDEDEEEQDDENEEEDEYGDEDENVA